MCIADQSLPRVRFHPETPRIHDLHIRREGIILYELNEEPLAQPKALKKQRLFSCTKPSSKLILPFCS